MSLLCIDIGSYSVKFLEAEVSKKNFVVLSHREIPIAKVLSQFGPDATLQDVQMSIVKSYLDGEFDGKVIMQLPSQFITSRYLKLPVNNRKKAELMVPFQLDEDLPFSMSNAHHIMSLRKRNDNFEALVTVAKVNEFEPFHDQLEQAEILPNLLSSELNFANSFARVHAANHPYAIIDIGHATTKAYFINGGEVVANHVSHTAGRLLDDVIAKTYTIPISEAVAYKQANAFFLTDAQYNEVTPEQREFAEIMKQSFWPLVNEIKRWELGFRVNYGQSIESIYLVGGSSRINNISNFLSQAVGIRCELLDFTPWTTGQDDQFEDAACSLAVSNMMAISQIDKEPVPNFLYGAFSNTMAGQLPLYSLSFLGVRIAALCLILSGFLFVERLAFLNRESKMLDNEINKQLKSPVLNMPVTERRYYPAQPARILNSLKKRTTSIQQEIKLVQSAQQKRALTPLVRVSEILSVHRDTKVAFFEADNGLARAVITAEEKEKLDAAVSALMSADLNNFQQNPGKTDKEASVSFDY